MSERHQVDELHSVSKSIISVVECIIKGIIFKNFIRMFAASHFPLIAACQKQIASVEADRTALSISLSVGSTILYTLPTEILGRVYRNRKNLEANTLRDKILSPTQSIPPKYLQLAAAVPTIFHHLSQTILVRSFYIERWGDTNTCGLTPLEVKFKCSTN